MTRYRHALVIGKFYPPHRGHQHLIAAARQVAASVSVVVMASGAESIPLGDRMGWMAADCGGDGVRVTGVQCEAPLDLGDDDVWRAQVAAIRAALRSGRPDGGGPVDVVVAGEMYGARLASYFGAAHLIVDRLPDDMSATRFRSDPGSYWDALGPATRAGLACRIVVLGAESTGTTTVSAALAGHYRQRGGVWVRTRVVEEYGRIYTRRLWDEQRRAARAGGEPEPGVNDLVWEATDFDAVAREQTAVENRAAAVGSPVLICDTDALATSIWERRYLGAMGRHQPDWSIEPALPRHHLYLLTSHQGVRWEDDGIREGDLDLRAAMTDWFADALVRSGRPWVMLEGPPDARLAMAVRSIDPVLDRHMTFADALTGPGIGARLS